jgi:hypothetical protein
MNAGLTALLVVGLAVPMGNLLMAAFRHFPGARPIAWKHRSVRRVADRGVLAV